MRNCPNWAKKGFILEKVHGKVFVQIVCIVQVVCIVCIVSSVCIVCIVGIVPISLFVKLEIICFGFGMVYLVFGLFGVWCWCKLVAQTCNGWLREAVAGNQLDPLSVIVIVITFSRNYSGPSCPKIGVFDMLLVVQMVHMIYYDPRSKWSKWPIMVQMFHMTYYGPNGPYDLLWSNWSIWPIMVQMVHMIY